MATLYATRGLPGSGKSTHARVWVNEDRAHRARVNRDDIRQMVDAGVFEKGVTEPRIIAIRDAAILGALRKGIDVIADDTNLPQRTIRDLARLAKRSGGDFEVVDFTDVPLDVCLERDAARHDKKPVGEAVIRDMYDRYLKGRTLPLPLPEEDETEPEGKPYTGTPGAQRAAIVDIDGTVALKGARSPFDETRVNEDKPNEPVIATVRALFNAGYYILFVSGRTSGCRDATVHWLHEHVVPYFSLYMRAEGDMRKDSIVKQELFDQHIRDAYDVECVLDDRNQVVKMWRSLGLTVLQVAEGNF